MANGWDKLILHMKLVLLGRVFPELRLFDNGVFFRHVMLGG
jgi:hypothetical protein